MYMYIAYSMYNVTEYIQCYHGNCLMCLFYTSYVHLIKYHSTHVLYVQLVYTCTVFPGSDIPATK